MILKINERKFESINKMHLTEKKHLRQFSKEYQRNQLNFWLYLQAKNEAVSSLTTETFTAQTKWEENHIQYIAQTREGTAIKVRRQSVNIDL